MNAIKHELLTLEVESGLKTELERVCHKLGMNISTAFAILARKFIREQETSEIDSGTAKLYEHELIED